MAMNLWRNRHNPPDVEEQLNTVSFAVEQGIVGVDWDVRVGEDESLDWETYQERAEDAGYSEKQTWVRALNAIHDHMEEGDLCYTRDDVGRFYLGRVHGPWQYKTGAEFKRHALVNVRDCDWHRIPDPEETVPPQLMASFNRGAVLQRVHDPRLRAYSQRLLEVLDGREQYDINLAYTMDSWLGDHDLRDLLVVYLQAEEDQILLPSTVEKRPFQPDGITVNRISARRTLYEVQHEDERLPEGAYADEDRRVVYLARDDDPPQDIPDHVQVIHLEDLKAVFDIHWDLLPRRIQIIAETLRDRGNLDWTGAGDEFHLPHNPAEQKRHNPSEPTGEKKNEEPNEPSPDSDSSRPRQRGLTYGLIGFLLGLVIMGYYGGWWDGSASVTTNSQQQVVSEQTLDELREEHKELLAQGERLQQSLDSLAGSREADRQTAASGAPETVWVDVRVRWADTLSELYYRFQRSPELYEEVIQRNDIGNPDLIHENSTLTFPTRPTKTE